MKQDWISCPRNTALLPMVSAFFFLWPLSLSACPLCGAGEKASDPTAYFLMGFLGLTYVPLFLIYRIIYRNRHLGRSDEDRPSAERR